MELLNKISEEVNSGEITGYKDIDARLSELRETYGSEVPDASTKEGYDRSKSIAKEMTSARTSLESRRKEFKAPILALGKMVDSEAKRIQSEIIEIESPHKEAYKAVDEVKAARKLAIQVKIDEIRDLPNKAIESHSSVIETMINNLADEDVSKEVFGRRVDEASALVASVLDQLTNRHVQAIEREAEAAKIEAERVELEALRREREDREIAARKAEEDADRAAEDAKIAERAAVEAIEQEKLRQKEESDRIEREKNEAIAREAEAKRQAEEAERLRVEAEEKAKRDAEIAKAEAKRQAEEAAEAARLAEVKRQKDEEDRKTAEREALEANKRHVGAICKQSKEDLMAIGLDEESAKAVVSAIAKGQIRNLSITY